MKYLHPVSLRWIELGKCCWCGWEFTSPQQYKWEFGHSSLWWSELKVCRKPCRKQWQIARVAVKDKQDNR